MRIETYGSPDAETRDSACCSHLINGLAADLEKARQLVGRPSGTPGTDMRDDAALLVSLQSSGFDVANEHAFGEWIILDNVFIVNLARHGLNATDKKFIFIEALYLVVHPAPIQRNFGCAITVSIEHMPTSVPAVGVNRFGLRALY
jgi:hypothetical protein